MKLSERCRPVAREAEIPGEGCEQPAECGRGRGGTPRRQCLATGMFAFSKTVAYVREVHAKAGVRG